jgi:hypothetical protein
LRKHKLQFISVLNLLILFILCGFNEILVSSTMNQCNLGDMAYLRWLWF